MSDGIVRPTPAGRVCECGRLLVRLVRADGFSIVRGMNEIGEKLYNGSILFVATGKTDPEGRLIYREVPPAKRRPEPAPHEPIAIPPPPVRRRVGRPPRTRPDQGSATAYELALLRKSESHLIEECQQLKGVIRAMQRQDDRAARLRAERADRRLKLTQSTRKTPRKRRARR